MSDGKINLGPAADMMIVSIDDDPEDPMNPCLQLGANGLPLRRNISLQVMDSKTKLWKSTDRAFKGEIHRFVLSQESSPLNATPDQLRAWYQSNDYPFPTASMMRSGRSDPYVVAGWIVGILFVFLVAILLSKIFWG